jgi:hypothetical protein
VTTLYLTLSLAPGQSQAFDTGVLVDGTLYYYDMTCEITANFDDPEPSNNSHNEAPGP